MPVAPFVPLIATGISTGASMLGGRQKAPGMSPAVQQASQIAKIGMPLMSGTASLYERMLKGDRTTLRNTVLPQRQEITDIYRGAESSLDRSGVRGPARDVASGNLARDQAGRLASLVPQAQQMALAGAERFGQQSQSLVGSLLGHETNQGQLALANRKYGDEQSGILGGNLAKLLTDFYSAYEKSRKGKGGGGYGSGPTAPGSPAMSMGPSYSWSDQ